MDNEVFKIVLDAPEITSQAQPGQFVQVKTSPLAIPLLRRPISIADIKDNKLTLFYRLLGEGTNFLSHYKPGETVDILGPLGHGFKLEGKNPLLVGGGIGIAPLLYLARLFHPATPADILLAGRCAAEMFWVDIFKPFCKNIYITTDDGSMGTKGNAMALLPELLHSGQFDHLYTCGPDPMLKGVAKETQLQKIPAQLSLERYMCCGLGACLACACEGTDGKRLKVCLNGPVFNAGEVLGL